jgi:flagellar biogenesis protein FliO
MVEMLLTVLAVVLLSGLLLYAARRTGLSSVRGPLSLVGRLPLEPRRTVYLVRVGSAVYVLASSEAGFDKLGELAASELGAPDAEPAPNFREVLARALRRQPERAHDERR